jgi:hypothetical protein
MKQLKPAFEFRRVGPTRSMRGLIGRFDQTPRSSLRCGAILKLIEQVRVRN